VGHEYNPQAVLLNTVMYRIFNKRETMEVIGFQTLDEWDPQRVISKINMSRENDLTAFSSAYMVTGAVGGKGSDKVEAYTNEVFDPLYEELDYYMEPIWVQDSPESLVERLEELPGISSFISYEIYTDLTYHEWFPWNENSYVNPGPGAKRGIQRLLERDPIDSDAHSDIEYKEHLEYIRDTANSDWFPDELKWNDKDWTLRTAEHQMCELDKWLRAKEEETIRLRRFDNSETEELGIKGEETPSKNRSALGEF